MCPPMKNRTAGTSAEWKAFAVEGVQEFALMYTDASRTVGGNMMVQHVIDSMLHQQTPTWVESADPAVNVYLCGR